MIGVPVVESQLETVEDGARVLGQTVRVEYLVRRVQWHRGASSHRVVTVDECEAFHVIERAAVVLGHQELSVPSEVLKLGIHQPYPSHLISIKEFTRISNVPLSKRVLHALDLSAKIFLL